MPQESNVLLSWGRIVLPPIISSQRFTPDEPQTLFEGYESIKYHILWQYPLSKGARYVVDVDIWPKKGWLVFYGRDTEYQFSFNNQTPELP